MSAAATSLVVDASASPTAKTLRPSATLAPVACVHCEGAGTVDVSRPHEHVIEERCEECCGTGEETFFAVHSIEDGRTHIWPSERVFDDGAAAACGMNPQDTRISKLGEPWCAVCERLLDGRKWR